MHAVYVTGYKPSMLSFVFSEAAEIVVLFGDI